MPMTHACSYFQDEPAIFLPLKLHKTLGNNLQDTHALLRISQVMEAVLKTFWTKAKPTLSNLLMCPKGNICYKELVEQ